MLRPAPRHQRRPEPDQPTTAPAPGPPSPATSAAPVPPSYEAPAPTLSATALARYARLGQVAATASRGTDAEPVVLVYPGVDAGGGRAVTPRRLADHLAVLHATGHRTVDLQALVDHALGRARLPARSVLIAFEPGAGGLHRSADPALAAHGARALALLADPAAEPPGRPGPQPGSRGGPGALDELVATGRWEAVPAGDLGFAAPRRLEVTGAHTAAALLAEIGEMASVAVADLAPNLVSRSWRDPDGGRAPMVARGADLAVGPAPDHVAEVVADWAPQRTAGWERYAVTVRVGGLGAEGAAGLRVRTGRVGEVAAVLSAGRLVLRRGGGARSSHTLVREAGEHVLRLDVERGWVAVTVDGRELARVPALDGDHELRVGPGADGEVVATAGSLGVIARRGPEGLFPSLDGLVVSAPQD